MATQDTIASALDMSVRNLRDVLKKIKVVDHTKLSIKEITIKYIRHLREQAAGRGGDDQKNLTTAKTEESQIKTAKMRIEYYRDLGVLITTEEAASVISLWARQANTDYTQGTHKLISEIQNRYNIKIDNEMVENIVTPTTERIRCHAEKLGAGLVEGIDDIPPPESTSNG